MVLDIITVEYLRFGYIGRTIWGLMEELILLRFTFIKAMVEMELIMHLVWEALNVYLVEEYRQKVLYLIVPFQEVDLDNQEEVFRLN